MSSPTWTPGALESETRGYKGEGWRFVEAQHLVSTLKLVDTLAERSLLEELIEQTKPAIPEDCRHLDYLLSTPFRYDAPYPTGSRFRRAGRTPGVFYASEEAESAVAEIVFYRLLFFAESPGTPWPRDAIEFTAFATAIATVRALDLTVPPLAADRTSWIDPVDYEPCQDLADSARHAGIELIRYESVRDPHAGCNLAVLACKAFPKRAPSSERRGAFALGAPGSRPSASSPTRVSSSRSRRSPTPDWLH